MGPVTNKRGSQIVYFEREGRDNLVEVIRVVKRALKKREELRSFKLVIFTAAGEGPWHAYNQLAEYEPRIIAVTFPIDFSVKRGDERVFPRISPKLKKFFDGVGVTVVSPAPLPWDLIEGMELHNQQMKTVKAAITLFGGGFTMCIQAVLRACDGGHVESGERVIAVSGDCAALITAATSRKFLGSEGLTVHEIFCKPRNFNIARPQAAPSQQPVQESFDKKLLTPSE